LADDERFTDNATRVRHRTVLIETLEAALATDTAAAWSSRMVAAGVPCGPINDLAAAFALAAELDLGPITTMESASGAQIAQLSNPIRLSGTPARYTLPPPRLGADGEAIMRWLNTAQPSSAP
jgi:crotonobetainyl-CoA:carnitine CoA-transferase CaiB-like acyl-CoA transferase